MKAPWPKTVNIIAVLVVGFLLTHDLASAESLDDAIALTRQVVELINLGHISDAVPLARAFTNCEYRRRKSCQSFQASRCRSARCHQQCH